MRKSQQSLVSIRSLDAYGTRHLGTRGSIPLDLEKLEGLAPRQSMRSAIAHFSYPRVTKINTAQRWLRQQVGRKWDDVYSGLRAKYRTQRNVADIALERLLGQVERTVFQDAHGKWQVRGAYDVYAVNGLFVNPTTGNLDYADLTENSAQERKLLKQQREVLKAQSHVAVSDTLQLHKLDGLWFWVELAAITAPQYIQHPDYVYSNGTRSPGYKQLIEETLCTDVLSGRQFYVVPTEPWNTAELRDRYGNASVYAKRKWQASREDVKRHVSQEPLAA